MTTTQELDQIAEDLHRAGIASTIEYGEVLTIHGATACYRITSGDEPGDLMLCGYASPEDSDGEWIDDACTVEEIVRYIVKNPL